MAKKISILIPVYNECHTIRSCLERVLKVNVGNLEITAKISRNKMIKIFEVPITINFRRHDEGKKVKWWHFFTFLYHIVKWRFIN